jgi:hypothetical protein
MTSATASVGRSSGGGDCCPHVVDAEWFGLFLLALAGVTIFLGVQITMNIVKPRRRKRETVDGGDDWLQGTASFDLLGLANNP